MACSLLVLLPLAGCGDDAGSAEETTEAVDIPRGGVRSPFVDGPDLWLAAFTAPEDPTEALPRLGIGRNVTERAGYDNQPAFAPDGAVLYTLGTGERTDIWRYDPETDTHRPVLMTSDQSEYSPTPIPGANAISIIRVEADSAQRLWRIELGPEGVARSEAVILPEIDPVGYHGWIDAETLALFVLGRPATLQLAAPGPGPGRVVDDGIGRGLVPIPGEAAVSYTRVGPEGAVLHRIEADGSSRPVQGLGPLPTQDHAWTPGGVLVFGEGPHLMGWRPGVDAAPERIGTLPDPASSISRLALSPDGTRIVLVVERSTGG